MAWILIEQFSCGEMSQNPFLFIYFFATLFLTLNKPARKITKIVPDDRRMANKRIFRKINFNFHLKIET